MAAAAVIHVDGSYGWKLVKRQLLPFVEHNAFRAESFAILNACNVSYRITIYTDCPVQQLLDELLECHAFGRQPKPFLHGDIWDSIWWHIQQREIHDVVVHKVAAHRTWQDLPEGTDRMHAFYNEQVDGQAKLAVTLDIS